MEPSIDALERLVRDALASGRGAGLDRRLVAMGDHAAAGAPPPREAERWLWDGWRVAEPLERHQLAHLFIRAVGASHFPTEADVRH